MTIQVPTIHELNRLATLTLQGGSALLTSETYIVGNDSYTWDGSVVKLIDNKPRRLVMFTDSEFTQNYLHESRGGHFLENILQENGVDCEVFTCAVNAHTFYRSNNTRSHGTKTLTQKVISYNPTDICVALGHNDAFSKTDSRTAEQVEADALETFTALRTALPNANIYYMEQTPYDTENFTAATLKNKGIGPGFFTLRDEEGLLDGCYCEDILDDDVDSATKEKVTDWEALRDYIRTLKAAGLITDYFDLEPWKPIRLGFASTDLVHNNTMGQIFLYGMIIKKLLAIGAPLVSSLADQSLDNAALSTWNDPEAVFDALLSDSGDAFTITWPATLGGADVTAVHNNFKLSLDNWYMPYRPFLVECYPTVVTNDSQPTDRLNWSIKGAAPFTAVELSLGGSAFDGATTRQADGVEIYTDAFGNASDSLLVGEIGIPDGAYVIRFKIGNQITKPFTITLATPE